MTPVQPAATLAPTASACFRCALFATASLNPYPAMAGFLITTCTQTLAVIKKTKITVTILVWSERQSLLFAPIRLGTHYLVALGALLYDRRFAFRGRRVLSGFSGNCPATGPFDRVAFLADDFILLAFSAKGSVRLSSTSLAPAKQLRLYIMTFR
jgi:hypothetical protein